MRTIRDKVFNAIMTFLVVTLFFSLVGVVTLGIVFSLAVILEALGWL